MLIVCKGIRSKGKSQNCKFIYDGDWGDEKLLEHEKLHTKKLESGDFWLGFDVSRSFGKFSGRDGKRE